MQSLYRWFFGNYCYKCQSKLILKCASHIKTKQIDRDPETKGLIAHDQLRSAYATLRCVIVKSQKVYEMDSLPLF